MKLEGNLKGDKLQNGGLLIIDKKGEIIYEFRQERPSHFVSNDEILKVLKQEVFSNENLTHLKEDELDIKQNDENGIITNSHLFYQSDITNQQMKQIKYKEYYIIEK